MTTLRREAIKTTAEEISDAFPGGYKDSYYELVAEKIVDSLAGLKGFAFLKENRSVEDFVERQEELRDDLAENSLEAAVILGKPLGKAAQKVKDSLEFHTMICAELARLPYNFEGDVEKEQESFRKFLKEKRKLGQELKKWVDWWMSDEWRVANPPWKLTTIKVKWLEAFQTEKTTRVRPEYQKVETNDENTVPNPNKQKPAILRR